MQLENGVKQNSSIQFVDDKSPELNYKYFQGPVLGGNVLSINIEAAQCHVDVVAQFEKVPDIKEYEYGVINPAGHRNKTVLDIYEPKIGTWYFAVMSQMNCTFEIEYKAHYVCPNNCSDNGSCNQGVCDCTEGFTFDDCSQPLKSLASNEKISDESIPFNYMYYSVEVKNQNFTVKVNVTTPGTNVYKRVMLKHKELPTLVSNDKEIDKVVGVNSLNIFRPKAGTWYIGIFANGTFKYDITASDEVKCPNNCSNNGKCNNGHCECKSNYKTSPDCSKYVRKVKFQNTFDEVYQPYEWKYYKAPGKFRTLTNVNITSKTPMKDLHLYAERHKEPSLIEYLEAKHCTKETCTLSIPSSSEHIYFGVYSKHNETIQASVFFEQKRTCPNECSLNGLCLSGICHCSPEYKGDDCSVHELALVNNEKPVYGHVNLGEMKYYKLQIAKFTTMKFFITNIREGSLKLFIRPDEYPTLTEYDKSVSSKHTKSEITARISTDSQKGVWYLGVYGVTLFTQYEVSAIAETHCPNSCSSHGYCLDGTCVCNPGWTSNDCSGKLSNITEENTVVDRVGFDVWNFFNFKVEKETGIKIVVREQNNQIQGVVWSFMSNGRVPRIEDSDFKNQSVSQVHTMQIPYTDSVGNWTIGITGSPRSPIDYRNSSYQISIYTGCKAYSTCGMCTTDPSCGWCRTDLYNSSIGHCIEGQEYNPSSGMCSLYSYTQCDLLEEYSKSLKNGLIIGGSTAGVVVIASVVLIILWINLKLSDEDGDQMEDDIPILPQNDPAIFESNVPIITHKYYGATLDSDDISGQTLTQSQIYQVPHQPSEEED